MSMQAAAIVRIDAQSVRAALASAGEEKVRIEALDDATIVDLGIGLGSEPEELAARLRALLGDVLDAHEDPRGVPVYPSTYSLQARAWDAAVEELGEAADWVKVAEGGAMAADVANVLSAFGLDPSDVAQMEKAFTGGEDGDVFAAAVRAAREMAERGVFKDLAERMRSMGVEQDAQKALERAGADARLAGMGLDLEALAAEAQRMLDENPALEEEIRKALEEAGDDEDE